MNTYAKLIVAAAAVLLVAVVGYQFLPRSGGVGGEPTVAPSPSPSLLARGNFTAQGILRSSMRPEAAQTSPERWRCPSPARAARRSISSAPERPPRA